MIKKTILLFLLIFISSCVTTKEIKHQVSEINLKPISKINNSLPKSTIIINKIYIQNNNPIFSYINDYNEIAMNNMKIYGIPASIILAQGILESSAGQGYLALNAYNHFGIKCHNNWNGDIVYKDDDKPNECFRKYNKVSESYKDHAEFLLGKKRYSVLFTLPKDDYKKWAYHLHKAGYATDSKYADKLINIIETYHLYNYDKKVLTNS